MRYILVIVLCVLSVVACSANSTTEFTVDIHTPVGEKITLEVVSTPETRAQGLMFRESLGNDEGMLFVFPDTQVRNFWMKNTSIPLSIAYLNANGVVVSILDMVPYSLDAVNSKYPARYAIEMNQGAFDRYDIEVGTQIDIPLKAKRNVE